MQPSKSSSDEPVLTLANGKQVLADGRIVSTVVVPKPAAQLHTEVMNGRAASRTLERIHRKLGDLPAEEEKLNAIACILMYDSLGLSDADIAIALRTNVDNIQRFKDLDAYKQLAEMFDRTVFDDAKRTANHIVTRAASKAAERMVDAINSGDESVAVVASREVMKLSGVGVDQRDTSKVSGLNIKIIRSSDKKDDEITVEIK